MRRSRRRCTTGDMFQAPESEGARAGSRYVAGAATWPALVRVPGDLTEPRSPRPAPRGGRSVGKRSRAPQGVGWRPEARRPRCSSWAHVPLMSSPGDAGRTVCGAAAGSPGPRGWAGPRPPVAVLAPVRGERGRGVGVSVLGSFPGSPGPGAALP